MCTINNYTTINNYSFLMSKKKNASKKEDLIEDLPKVDEQTWWEVAPIEDVWPTTIQERVEQEFSTMLSAYWDANMLQLRSETWIWWQWKLNELLAGSGKVRDDILKLDPNSIAENADQYIKILQLQANTAKKVTTFAGGKDTKDAVVIAQVKPLLPKATRKW